MPLRIFLFAVAMAACAAAPIAHAANPADEKLVMKETDDAFELSVPVSRLVLVIPREGLAIPFEPGRPAARSPRYFHLADRDHGVSVSGWIESAETYKGVDALWKEQNEAWAQSHAPLPSKEPAFLKVDKWDTIIYDLDVPRGVDTHIRCEWVELGTWIDMHIAVTNYDKIEVARARAMSLLKDIKVREAKGEPLPNAWPLPEPPKKAP